MDNNQSEAESQPIPVGGGGTKIHGMMRSMLEVQNGLNLKFVGPDWPAQAMQRTRINYGSAILEEAQELQASDVSWKWWKTSPAKPDTDNMKIELVDLLHFAMSESIAENYMDVKGADEDAQENNQDGTGLGADICMGIAIGDLAFALEEGFISAFRCEDALHSSNVYDPVQQRNALHALVASALQGINTVSVGLEEGETFNDGDANDSSFGDEEGGGNVFTPVPGINWTAFWSVAYHTGLSLADVYSTYMGKASLNSFRIANGDKAGDYHRKWQDGREDNYYLMEYFKTFFKENGLFPTLEQTTNWLTTAYAEYCDTPQAVTAA